MHLLGARQGPEQVATGLAAVPWGGLVLLRVMQALARVWQEGLDAGKRLSHPGPGLGLPWCLPALALSNPVSLFWGRECVCERERGGREEREKSLCEGPGWVQSSRLPCTENRAQLFPRASRLAQEEVEASGVWVAMAELGRKPGRSPGPPLAHGHRLRLVHLMLFGPASFCSCRLLVRGLLAKSGLRGGGRTK